MTPRPSVLVNGPPPEENVMQLPTLEIMGCPECVAPAEVADRFVLESADGPIEHAIVTCTERHRFTVLVERMASRTGGRPRPTTARRRRTTSTRPPSDPNPRREFRDERI
jgi:hypothetical protein